MKSQSLLCISVLLAFSYQVSASELHNPDIVAVSAKYAKLKAKQRALRTKADDTISQAINTYNDDDDPGSCNLNVGNVIVEDGVGNGPDEVIVIIEGDIIQSNNCS